MNRVITCEICPHYCKLKEGQIGICHGRINTGDQVTAKNYGKLTAISLDPIEKKPLKQFYPGSMILSLGSYGCNLKCPFCQNCEISMVEEADLEILQVTPQEIVEKALKLKTNGNIGLAYTYNEPLIGYEFVRDCSVLAKRNGLKNVVVTNGFINEEPFVRLLPSLDALNIDLKGFTESFYGKIGGKLGTVKKSIELSSKSCHVEVTTLIIPGENDSEEEMEALSTWLSSVSPEIPLHITRFFPRYRMRNKEATPIETIYRLAKIAKDHLRYVYEGNL